ncbi:hypothetical protein AAEX28_06600 [Lentisphaerota bacterium WC36G]|nr:hypothetical protein LJT99_09465 [Lentisphaerae bacterium WC36]
MFKKLFISIFFVLTLFVGVGTIVTASELKENNKAYLQKYLSNDYAFLGYINVQEMLKHKDLESLMKAVCASDGIDFEECRLEDEALIVVKDENNLYAVTTYIVPKKEYLPVAKKFNSVDEKKLANKDIYIITPKKKDVFGEITPNYVYFIDDKTSVATDSEASLKNFINNFIDNENKSKLTTKTKKDFNLISQYGFGLLCDIPEFADGIITFELPKKAKVNNFKLNATMNLSDIETYKDMKEGYLANRDILFAVAGMQLKDDTFAKKLKRDLKVDFDDVKAAVNLKFDFKSEDYGDVLGKAYDLINQHLAELDAKGKQDNQASNKSKVNN